ncbi:hypothetical protein E2C01_043236 [Portunus trituberculatus]|uniref:Uncharacterized protein n=1 Tax=Portunus trituberculatus TaxID=210409 RepID=A0A5B7FVJ9_PORTR|nr:hypothetical protein [Portunus trituberculatus]
MTPCYTKRDSAGREVRGGPSEASGPLSSLGPQKAPQLDSPRHNDHSSHHHHAGAGVSCGQRM